MASDTRLRELMQAYQSGRFEAFDDLYAAIAPALRRYLLSHARDAAKADDLVQETFLQLHRARHTYDRGVSCDAVGHGHRPACVADGSALAVAAAVGAG